MRVLIVDDHEVVRRGIRSLLQTKASFEICGEAVDGLDAVEKARESVPDVIIMDISMPNLNGLEATRQIRGIVPTTEIVILSQHESVEMARQAFKAGARGYVVKASVSKNLLKALETANAHEPYFDPSITGIAEQAASLDVQGAATGKLEPSGDTSRRS